MALPVAYVIRIYRRPGRRTGPLAGTIKPIGGGLCLAFRSSAGLWDILSGTRCRTRGRLTARSPLRRRGP